MELCKLCETRKPRRYCPGVTGEICAQCCGAEREVTVECPLDCEHLMEARRHEKMIEHIGEAPNADVRIDESFVDTYQPFIAVLASGLLQASLSTPGAVDSDVREALEALIKTHKTSQSGLIYETRPSNPYADSVQQRFKQFIEEIKEKVYQDSGVHSVRDADILRVLVFFQRLALLRQNGRRRGKSFLSSLWMSFPPGPEPKAEPGSPIITS